MINIPFGYEGNHAIIFDDNFFLSENSVKGLDEDEAHFLEFVSNKQIEINKARSEEEKSIFKELKVR